MYLLLAYMHWTGAVCQSITIFNNHQYAINSPTGIVLKSKVSNYLIINSTHTHTLIPHGVLAHFQEYVVISKGKWPLIFPKWYLRHTCLTPILNYTDTTLWIASKTVSQCDVTNTLIKFNSLTSINLSYLYNTHMFMLDCLWSDLPCVLYCQQQQWRLYRRQRETKMAFRFSTATSTQQTFLL